MLGTVQGVGDAALINTNKSLCCQKTYILGVGDRGSYILVKFYTITRGRDRNYGM